MVLVRTAFGMIWRSLGNEKPPVLIKKVDVLGGVQQEHKKGSLLFYIYDNGKVEKKFNL